MINDNVRYVIVGKALRRIFRATRMIESLRGPGIRKTGDTLRIDVTAGHSNGTPTTRGVELRLFTLVDSTPVQNDYVLAQGVNPSTTVKIGKPYLLQQTPFDGSTLDGLTYSYTDGTKRNVSDGSENEDQIIVPSYTIVSNAIILAARGLTRGPIVQGDPIIEWIDLNVDGRAWAKEEA